MSQISKDINTIDRYLRRNRRAYMEPLGMKGIHAWIIDQVCANPGCSQDQLAKKLWIDKSTIARQLELMEEAGFIQRKASQTDKRVLCVYPTERALQFLPGLQAATEEKEALLLQGLTAQERQQFSALLRRVCAAAEMGE